MTVVVELRGLVKQFEGGRVHAVDGIDLTTEEGEYLVLLGPSGCGKTTLLRTIARARATRWRSPPDSWRGRRSSSWSMPSSSAAQRALRTCSSLSIRSALSGKTMFWRTFLCGYRA